MNEKTIKKIGRVRNDGRWHSRGSDWGTPQDLFNELNEEFGFTLDPCASEWNKKCDKYFTEEDNGLKKDWGKNKVFMNPPYGKVLKEWMEKAYNSSLNGATVVCLVPSATDLEWWHKFAMKGEIRFLRGRPRFVTKEGNWQQTFSPSVIVVFKSSLREGHTNNNSQHTDKAKASNQSGWEASGDADALRGKESEEK